MGLAISVAPSLTTSVAHAAKPQGPAQSQSQSQRAQAAAPRAAAPRATAQRAATPSRQVSTSRQASAGRQTPASRPVAAAPGKRGAQSAKNSKMRVARGGGGLQCVPFARNASGIEVAGNAHTWWENAAGTYARGQSPERGSVLSFRANRSMPLGHVAVVARVVNARELEIDHANWAGPGGRKGAVARGVSVVDVSETNDWSAVRVALGRSGDYGSIYPANGFIYDRPDTGGGIVLARASRPAPMPELNAAPRDLRPLGGQSTGYASVGFVNGGNFEEVAEAPAPRAPLSPRRKPVKPRR